MFTMVEPSSKVHFLDLSIKESKVGSLASNLSK